MLGSVEREQVERVVGLVQELLGADALGMYLFGSAVMGGLQPGSDLDLLVVSRRPTTQQEQGRLVRGLLPISGRSSDQGRLRHIELTIVVQGDVRPWRYPPSFDFLYDDWLRDEFEKGNLHPWPRRVSPDLAIVLSKVLMAHEPLVGPPAGELLDPVPRDDLERAMVDSLKSLLGDLAWDTRNVILTLARIWMTLATGAIGSKTAAADWVLERLPETHRPVLLRAREIYLGQHPERWDGLEDRIDPAVDHILAEIRRLAPR